MLAPDLQDPGYSTKYTPICDLSRFSKLYQEAAGQPYPFSEEKTKTQRGGIDHVSVCRFEQSRDEQEMPW